MGGSRPVDWLDDLGAAFEAAEAREEEIAAADLAFSLRQDVELATALAGRGWTLLLDGGAGAAVDEVGVDYVLAGPSVVRARNAVLRSGGRLAPVRRERSLAELLGAACRAGAAVEVRAGSLRARGTLVTVGHDHLELRREGTATVIGLDAVDSVTLCAEGGAGGYSASRGFSG